MSERKKEFLVDLINKMFEIAGHDVTYEDIEGRKDAWYNQWTMTEEQNQEWIDYGMASIKKVFRYPKKVCQKEMMWINLMYGLKVKNHE
jgi:hypothetical protein